MILKQIVNEIERIELKYNDKIGSVNTPDKKYNEDLDYLLCDLLDIKFFIKDYLENEKEFIKNY